jgi:general secretion pathway protein L
MRCPANRALSVRDELPMTMLATITGGFWRWIDTVAVSLDGLIGRYRSGRTLHLVENDDGTLTLQTGDAADTATARSSMGKVLRWRRSDGRAGVLAPIGVRIANGVFMESLPGDWVAALRGSRVEIGLHPRRFLLQPLELPRQAAEFLEGIVRAQIDRLTPWNAGDAVFGWTRPVEADDRIKLSVVATARSTVWPYLNSLAGFGASSVTVSTRPQECARVTVLTQHAQGAAGAGRLRRVLAVVIILSGLAALASVTLGGMALDALDSELADLSHKIAARRVAMRLGEGSAAASAERALAQRKQTTPSSVLVLEALSKILPDHTYVTELRIEGDKLELVGITRDAPSLIELIEQSAQFTHATFFAPTTQTPGDPGERFHIEARIKPEFGQGT